MAETKKTATIYRLRELDFLRGIAIILVLFRHQLLFQFTKNMGWIGVDLFFVLSGFLVSGLLFREYLKFGNIQPTRFLIRRGFKIYPIYYLSYLLYLVPMFINKRLQIGSIISDLTFTQNYVNGFGYAYVASWSLAVEEHFYFGLALLLWLVLKKNMIQLQKDKEQKGIDKAEGFILTMLLLCLILRIVSNYFYPGNVERNFTMTHLRIDSLLTGVLISYLYYFRNEYLTAFFKKYKRLLFIIAIAAVSWTPFILPVFFVQTFGFTLLYISFGILLIIFLLTTDINNRLNKIFSATVVTAVSKIGYCSYSIYIIHSLVNALVDKMQITYHLYHNNFLYFSVTSVISILGGMVITHSIESYFLKIRDKYYPNRAA